MQGRRVKSPSGRSLKTLQGGRMVLGKVEAFRVLENPISCS